MVMIALNMTTTKVAAKLELLFNKPASDALESSKTCFKLQA
jgi:hypothetical protein